MSDVKAKMLKIRFLGRSRPAGGACSAPPDPLAVFNGPTSKGREGKRKGKGSGGPPIFWPRTAPVCIPAAGGVVA